MAVFVCYYLISTIVFTYLYPAKEVLTKQKLRHFKLCGHRQSAVAPVIYGLILTDCACDPRYKQRCEALLTKRRSWYKEYQQIAINKD